MVRAELDHAVKHAAHEFELFIPEVFKLAGLAGEIADPVDEATLVQVVTFLGSSRLLSQCHRFELLNLNTDAPWKYIPSILEFRNPRLYPQVASPKQIPCTSK